jgi:lipid-A-disaccharide synthase
MSIFISTGELSGDLYAAKISSALHKINPDELLWGMGGTLAAGVDREWNNDLLHILGLGKILKNLSKLLSLRRQLATAVIQRQPKAVIVIDSPDFHIPLLAKIRSMGYKGRVFYICPPTIWAWRSGRAKYLKRYCDLCFPLFKFEETALEEHGVKSFWCGNPLIDDLDNYIPQQILPEDPSRIALLPGSRKSEITNLMPILEEVALKLKRLGFRPVFSVAPGLDDECKNMVVRNKAGIEFTLASGRDLMFQSQFVIGASGTASVEAMLLGKYMIVLYKGTALEWHIYKALTHTRFVSIPNVLAGRMFFPELIQDDAKADKVLHFAEKYINDVNYRENICEQLVKNRSMMGSKGTVERWAETINKLVNS